MGKVFWALQSVPVVRGGDPATIARFIHYTFLMTLFQQGNDLSDDFMKVCYRRMRANTFDVYQMIDNPDVEIKHRARYDKPVWNEESQCYFPGDAYDSFNVWVKRNDNPSRPHYACVAEDLRSFEDAINVAKQYV